MCIFKTLCLHTLPQKVMINPMKTVKKTLSCSSGALPHLRGRIKSYDFRCSLVPIEGHILVKPQPNAVPPHTIYSRPTKLQSKHRLPSNSVSRKALLQLDLHPKKIVDASRIHILSCIHMCSLPQTWIYIATRLTLLKWFRNCFLLDLVCKTRTWGRVLKTMSLSNIWHHFRVPRNIASSIIGIVTQRG